MRVVTLSLSIVEFCSSYVPQSDPSIPHPCGALPALLAEPAGEGPHSRD